MRIHELQFWFLFAFIAVRVGVLTVLVIWDVIDPTFFTYQNFLFDTFLLILLSLSMWSGWSMELFTIVFYPLYWGTALFVSVAIVVIIHLNPEILMKTSPENGGDNDMGKIHTADVQLHQYPLVEVLFITLIFWPILLECFDNFYQRLNIYGKVGYGFYVHLCSLAILAFYMVNFNFIHNYPTSLPNWAVILLVAVLAVLAQTVLFLLLCIQRPSRTETVSKDKTA
jgi:hypothetical protein